MLSEIYIKLTKTFTETKTLNRNLCLDVRMRIIVL